MQVPSFLRAASIRWNLSCWDGTDTLVRVLVLGCHSGCHRCIQLQQQVLAMTETLSDASEPMSRVRVALRFESEVLIIWACLSLWSHFTGCSGCVWDGVSHSPGYIAEDELELMVFLPLPSPSWHSRHAFPRPTLHFFFHILTLFCVSVHIHIHKKMISYFHDFINLGGKPDDLIFINDVIDKKVFQLFTTSLTDTFVAGIYNPNKPI